MGSGSDVAKEAGEVASTALLFEFLIGTISAAMVLLNNDISSIVIAIEMGHLVFDNLKKVMIYLMPVCRCAYILLCL